MQCTLLQANSTAVNAAKNSETEQRITSAFKNSYFAVLHRPFYIARSGETKLRSKGVATMAR
jgi:hypothetical protein